VDRRLVTAAGAKRYGVVIDGDGALDSTATEALRAALVAARGDNVEVFNFGGDVEDIRARCEQETHLPAPVKPTFIAGG
jgi:N-methylhydantoinase B